MRRVLSTELGERLYRKHSQTVEPLFGNTKHNNGVYRFHRRGRVKVRTEWRLLMMTHNLGKLHRPPARSHRSLKPRPPAVTVDHDRQITNGLPPAPASPIAPTVCATASVQSRRLGVTLETALTVSIARSGR
jgi:Transposase DDE domain